MHALHESKKKSIARMITGNHKRKLNQLFVALFCGTQIVVQKYESLTYLTTHKSLFMNKKKHCEKVHG